MNLQNKKIGIWGFGIVGKSVLNYLKTQQCTVEVLDAKPLPADDQALLQSLNILFYEQDQLHSFLERNDYIVPSPGINILPYTHYAHKWLSELDLFATAYTKSYIAITGTVGKTSTTHLLGQLINASGTSVSVGGNIGIGMLDCTTSSNQTALLEVSSFQLEISTLFAPDLAIWTTFFPNHLDRHPDVASYFSAKYQLLKNQNSSQQALVPFSLYEQLRILQPKSCVAYFSATTPTTQDLNQLRAHETLFYRDQQGIVQWQRGAAQLLIDAENLPLISYQENWLIICAALTLLNIPLTVIAQTADSLSLPEHRLEKCATINKVVFYNDSKSTTPQSTLAAVHCLSGKPIHLLLGGISKGIDRTELIEQLSTLVTSIYCFGKEAEQLHALCTKFGISSSASATLDEALKICTLNAREGDQVLLSPAGASFDLYTNYEHRGNHFKKLVQQTTGQP